MTWPKKDAPARDWRDKSLDLRKHLRALTHNIDRALRLLDDEMRKPSDVSRGKRIAAICNELEIGNDMAKHFGLDISFEKMMNARKRRDQ